MTETDPNAVWSIVFFLSALLILQSSFEVWWKGYYLQGKPFKDFFKEDWQGILLGFVVFVIAIIVGLR